MPMFRWPLLLALALSQFACTPPEPTPVEPPFSGDAIPTSKGDLIIHPVRYATLVLGWAGKVIYVDPVGQAGLYEGIPSPDVVLVTDIGLHHLSPNSLSAVVRSGTVLITPQTVKDFLFNELFDTPRVLGNGQKTEVAGFSVEAVPMFHHHAKGQGNGYLLTLGGKRVYIAGDTEDNPEMRALRDIDVAFLPMDPLSTMTIEQAADVVRAFRPRIVYPYHQGASDVEAFSRLLSTEADIDVRLRAWY